MAFARLTAGRVARAALIAPMLAAGSERLLAQQAPRPRAEARVDYLGPKPHALQAGLGVNVPVGTYLRLALIGAAGPSWDVGRSGTGLRAEAIGRFSLDPFRERRWGLSAGGGLSVRYDQVGPSARRWRPLLAVVLDLEGPRTGAVAPAIQVGLGGGARVGMIVRGADPGRR